MGPAGRVRIGTFFIPSVLITASFGPAMGRIATIGVVAFIGFLAGCADLPTTSRTPGAPPVLASDELSEEELAGLEILPLEFLTVDPAFPGGHHWYNYWTYEQMGIAFKGGFLEGVYDFEATVPHAWKWYPDIEIFSVYPYRATYFHELRFTPGLGSRIRRVEFSFDNTTYGWNVPKESTYLTCYDRNGNTIGIEEMNGSGDTSPVVSGSIIGRDFARCRTESKNGYAVVGMRLTLLPEQTTKVALRCLGDLGEDRVTRGQTLRCEVRKAPATAPGDLAVSGWSFDGTPREDGDLNFPSWEGQMVAAGEVAVRARIGTGPEQTASASIEVVNRTWSAPTVTVQEVPNGADSRLTLPGTVVLAKDLGVSSFFFTARPGDLPLDPIDEVRGGPNNGLYYFKDLSFPIWAYYVLNRAAMQVGSGFYNAQDPAGDRPVRRGALNWCDKTVVAKDLLRLVEAHEREHIRVYTDAFTRELRLVMTDLEAIVDADFVAMHDTYDAQRLRIDEIGRVESEAIHRLSGNPFMVTPSDSQGDCALKNEIGAVIR